MWWYDDNPVHQVLLRARAVPAPLWDSPVRLGALSSIRSYGAANAAGAWLPLQASSIGSDNCPVEKAKNEASSTSTCRPHSQLHSFDPCGNSRGSVGGSGLTKR